MAWSLIKHRDNFNMHWKSAEPTWKVNYRTGYFEDSNSENRHWPYSVTFETEKWHTFECEQYDLNLKLLCLEES
jgi:hypothetical protein